LLIRASSWPYRLHARSTRLVRSSRLRTFVRAYATSPPAPRYAGRVPSAHAEHDLCAALSEHDRSRLAYPAACVSNDDDFVF
jgi:hypothetical protein